MASVFHNSTAALVTDSSATSASAGVDEHQASQRPSRLGLPSAADPHGQSPASDAARRLPRARCERTRSARASHEAAAKP